ncbi:hypothetical protein WA171_000076 [Blastocystis sp. BT1]
MSDIDLSICYCGWGYNRPMIRCCHCKRWYHYDCVNVTATDLEDPNHYYCFMCIDFKPDSDSGDDYDFDEDLKRQREMNREARKRVRQMLKDDTFSSKSVMSMEKSSILRTMCCIEQQLLLEDHSPSLHDSSLSYKQTLLQNVREDEEYRIQLLNTNPLMKELFFDIERSGEYKHVLSLSSYLVAREGNRRSNRFVPKYDEYWMQISRRLLDFEVPVNSVGINADIRTFDWRRFGRVQRELTGHLFDVVMMDPPWHLSSADPCRGVAIKYQQLDDESIASIPIHLIQDDGLLFLWTINAKYTTALRIIQNWGYVLIGDISWVKLSARNFVIQSNGFYLQHAKETCFVAKKGNCNALDKTKIGLVKDVIFSKRKGQSQKPNEIYSIIESLVPNGYYVEIFGRRNNLRNDWVTIGNEI